jgi:hypothetical protein
MSSYDILVRVNTRRQATKELQPGHAMRHFIEPCPFREVSGTNESAKLLKRPHFSGSMKAGDAYNKPSSIMVRIAAYARYSREQGRRGAFATDLPHVGGERVFGSFWDLAGA